MAKHDYLPRDYVQTPSQMWEVCNRCGYRFKTKENGEADGQDVLTHKREACPLREPPRG